MSLHYRGNVFFENSETEQETQLHPEAVLASKIMYLDTNTPDQPSRNRREYETNDPSSILHAARGLWKLGMNLLRFFSRFSLSLK